MLSQRGFKLHHLMLSGEEGPGLRRVTWLIERQDSPWGQRRVGPSCTQKQPHTKLGSQAPTCRQTVSPRLTQLPRN